MLDSNLCPNHPPDAYPWPRATVRFSARNYCPACAAWLAGTSPPPIPHEVRGARVVSSWVVTDQLVGRAA